METRRTRGKKVKYDVDYAVDPGDESESNDAENLDDLRKSRIRDSNKEFAKRMTILQTWSDHWSDYTTREGEAYPKHEARNIIKKAKKITCPIQSCRKTFTTVGGLRYHYARCNIERCFKCLVCNPPFELKTRGDLLRHMVRSHYEQLPTLEGEQKEIALAYLSSSGRVDNSKVRRFHGDPELQINCKSLVKSYCDLIRETFKPENFTKCPFKEWQASVRDWDLLTYEIDRRRYYPPERKSVHFKSFDAPWSPIEAGGCRFFLGGNSGQAKSLVFYTGGTSTSAAWFPKPPTGDLAQMGQKELLAISVNCNSMERSLYYKDSKDVTGCIQFWSVDMAAASGTKYDAVLNFMVGHNFGHIFEMTWCPLGASWQPKVKNDSGDNIMSRLGLLALACGDGLIRILSIPHLGDLPTRIIANDSIIESTQIYRVKPICTLMAPGVGPSTDCQISACTSLCWNVQENQRLIAAGYANGTVALFDLANYSPILYSTQEHRHIYQPLKSWIAHGMPVTGIGILSSDFKRTFIVTGSRDKQLKLWNSRDLNICLTVDKAPITRIIWDHRLKGVVSATESAFTSFQNRVSYRYPTPEGFSTSTLAIHRATVWGLASSSITSSLATSDEAGEVLVSPHGRPFQRRDRSQLKTHSVFTLLPREIDETTMSSATTLGDVSELQDMDVAAEVRLEPDGEESNEDDIQIEDEYKIVERPVANKPAKFLLPVDHRVVETYDDFKKNFGLEFVSYANTTTRKNDQKLPESFQRASDTTKIYCDRVCDYPFSSIKHVSWSPNLSTFAGLFSVAQIGLCRIEKAPIIEQTYKGHIESLCDQLLVQQQQQQQSRTE